MKIKNLEELDTPCLVLDKTRLEKNCSFAREKCIELKTNLRPHVKTPKSIEVAKIALDNQVGPITVSTLQEAEYFANSGFKDILYAVCIIPKKLARLDFLQKKYDCVIRMVIDSISVAKAIVDYSNCQSTKFETLIEIDCGEGRSGLYVVDKNIVELSKIFSECNITNLMGVLTH